MKLVVKSKRQRLVSAGLFLACAAFFFAIMLCVPLCSDDLEHAGREYTGMGELLRYCLTYGNGRLLGNLSMVLLSGCPLAAAALKALLISGMVFMLPALLGQRKPQMYVLSFLLFVLIRPSLFAQVYAWTSGFGNYVPPVWLGMAVLLLAQRCDVQISRAGKNLCCALIFVLGLMAQLFVEHASVVAVLVAGGLLLHSVKSKKTAAPYACWLVAALAGLALMLLIPHFFAIPGNRAEGYRGLINGGLLIRLEGMIRSAVSAVSAFPPVGSIIIAAFALVTLRLCPAQRSKKAESFIFAGAVFCLSYLLLNELLPHNEWTGRMQVAKNFVTAIFAMLPHVLWAWALWPFEDKRLRNRIYVLLLLSAVSLAPFVFVYPAPERVAFLSYVFAAAAIVLFAAWIFDKASPRAQRQGFKVLVCVNLAATLVLGMTFVNIFWLSGIRQQHIENEMLKGASEITIFQIPSKYVFWDGTHLFETCYYYEQRHDISFHETSFDDWYGNHWMK